MNNILGTSRGIGDSYLKRCVIPNPEVRAQELRPGDDFVVVATDGLWDVLSTSEVRPKPLRPTPPPAPAPSPLKGTCRAPAGTAEGGGWWVGGGMGKWRRW